MTYSIDNVDERILYRLQENARETSAPEIAEEMGVSASTIRKRIQKLEEDIIKGYHADIDYEKCNRRLTNVFECSVPAHERERVAEQALGVPGVVNVREMMTGKGNLLIKAVGVDTENITRISQKLTNLGVSIENESTVYKEYFSPYRPFGPEKNEETVPGKVREGENLVKITVADNAPIAGNTLQQANQKNLIPENMLVVSVQRGNEIITPRGDTRIEERDVIKVFSSVDIPRDTLSVFNEASG